MLQRALVSTMGGCVRLYLTFGLLAAMGGLRARRHIDRQRQRGQSARLLGERRIDLLYEACVQAIVEVDGRIVIRVTTFYGDPASGAHTLVLHVDLVVSRSGSVTFETVEPFVSVIAGFPSTGELVIHGANGATIRAVALDGTFVRLEIDADGDGVVDGSVDETWANPT